MLKSVSWGTFFWLCTVILLLQRQLLFRWEVCWSCICWKLSWLWRSTWLYMEKLALGVTYCSLVGFFNSILVSGLIFSCENAGGVSFACWCANLFWASCNWTDLVLIGSPLRCAAGITHEELWVLELWVWALFFCFQHKFMSPPLGLLVPGHPWCRVLAFHADPSMDLIVLVVVSASGR